MAFVKKCSALLLGIVVIVLLGQLVQIDTGVDNTVATLSYGALTIFALFFGPVLTPIVAFVGHFLSDTLTYTTVWWTWIVSDGVFGLLLGLVVTRLDLLKQRLSWTNLVQFNLWQGIANLLVWGLIAPLGDFLVYKSNWPYVWVQGITAAFHNFVAIGVIGTVFIWGYHVLKRTKENN